MREDTREGLREARPYIVGLVCVVLAFGIGHDMGKNADRPGDQACRDYIRARDAEATVLELLVTRGTNIEPYPTFDEADQRRRQADGLEGSCPLVPLTSIGQ